jgi:peptide/nickel transport system permease protein
MTEVAGQLGEPSLEDLAEREAIAAEPGLRDAIRRVLFERVSTRIAIVVVVIFVLVAVFAPVLAPYHPLKQSFIAINKLPAWDHWLGTDQFGRDVLSRLIYGSRNSLIFGLLSPVFAALFGTILGVTAGYFGGIVDRVISRVIDMLMAFPELLLAILVISSTFASNNMRNLFFRRKFSRW